MNSKNQFTKGEQIALEAFLYEPLPDGVPFLKATREGNVINFFDTSTLERQIDLQNIMLFLARQIDNALLYKK